MNNNSLFFFFYSPQTDFVWRQLIIDWEILKTPIRKVDQGAAETLETPEVAPQPIQYCFFRLKSKQGQLDVMNDTLFFFFYSPQTDFVWRQLIIDWEILKTPIRKVDQGAAETLETPEVAPQPTQSDLPVKTTRIDPQSLWINRLCLDSNSIKVI